MSEEIAEQSAKTNPIVMTHDHKLDNRFAIGDEVWAVVALGPDLKVGKYPIKGINAENIGGGFYYMYHLPVEHDGHADAVNMTIVREDLLFFDREAAEAKAHESVREIQKSYDDKIAELKDEYDKQMEDSKDQFEKVLAKLIEEREKCNADDLVIQPREAIVPTAEPAEPTPNPSPDEPANPTPAEGEASEAKPEGEESEVIPEGGETARPNTDGNTSTDSEQSAELQGSDNSATS